MNSAAHHAHAGHHGHQGGHGDHGSHGHAAASAVSHRLELATPRVTAGEKTDLRFSVIEDGEHGPRLLASSAEYEESHGKELHLIVASRDLSVYRHLHPVLGGDGIWSVPVELPKGGEYRVFADFRPHGGDPVTAVAVLLAEGAGEPVALPEPTGVALVDGYEVRLDGELVGGEGGALVFSVHKDGQPVTDLQPYLGAYGHLVALRAADLAYLHVHPGGEPGDGVTPAGPEVSFHAVAGGPGPYGLFLDFRHGDVVRTAAFTTR
ncbi:hypothetical protein AB0O01_04555 [Streptomyces sp. NPDC093252]|uniref:hypothetical protein n=1 Tax=Streptomyces sp. NPDC093252 TaxID=3154980 RepID=UPI00342259B7